MSRRLLLLNLAMAGLLVFGVVRLRRDIREFRQQHGIDRIQPGSDKKLLKGLPGAGTAAAQEWSQIAARNPFSFDRNDVALILTPPAAARPQRPKPILFGTMALGTDRLALLGIGDSGSRTSKPVRTGETFDGWQLMEIQDKSVVVQWEGIKETVILNDPTAQVQRDFSKTAAAAASQPAANLSVPAQAPATPAPPPAPTAANPPPAQPLPLSPAGKKQIMVNTPFGPRLMEAPGQ